MVDMFITAYSFNSSLHVFLDQISNGSAASLASDPNVSTDISQPGSSNQQSPPNDATDSASPGSIHLDGKYITPIFNLND